MEDEELRVGQVRISLQNGSKLNVNEEYQQAFRTKSYLEMCTKVEGQLGRTSVRRLSSASSSSLPLFKNLTEHLLEPRQETLTDMTETVDIHHLLLDYFEASLEACHYCDIILEAIHQSRINYRKIRRAIKLSNRVCEDQECTESTTQGQISQTHQAIYGELAAFAMHRNPLSVITPNEFMELHKSHMSLLHKLTSKRRKIRRKLKFKRICKKVGGIGLVISHSALLVAMLVLALHSIIGIVAAPGVAGCLAGLLKKRIKRVQSKPKASVKERLSEQLDVAARGVYILINDFGTLSCMVKRLYHEVEHHKAVAYMCVNNGKCEILKEVVREFTVHESSFLDQLEELEKHIYLCFLTVNRSRGLVIREIKASQQ